MPARDLSLSQAKILMVGVAYKKNVDDTRESPALNILEILQERGATTDFHDPHVVVIPETRRHAKLDRDENRLRSTRRQSVATISC